LASPLDPEELGTAPQPVAAEIAASTALGAVHLSVSDLARSVSYYRDAVGLALLDERPGGAGLGVGTSELLRLVELPGATAEMPSTGLYHFALLLPERADLARWLLHAVRDRVTLTGLSDHFVSEALYLSDPDGHGIEIYWDRPRELWEGQVASRLTTGPLDVDSLIGELHEPPAGQFEGLPAGAVMGHLHLKVSEVDQTVAFYRDILGFGLMAQLGHSAAFLGAGGYHHHIGANTWESAGASPPRPGHTSLLMATLVVPDVPERERVLVRVREAERPIHDGEAGPILEDPSGNRLLLAVA
jgi:catechol 2,3-dioxygenase